MTNCTFSGNTANKWGGGIFNYSNSPIVNNSIFWANVAGDAGDEIYNYDSSSDPNFMYCDIAGSGGSGPDWDVYLCLDGGGNIDADPMFIDPGFWDPNGTPGNLDDDFWVDGDYHLLDGSPCIDAGDPNFVADPNATDLDGKPRIVNGRIDIGAYEVQIDDPAELLEMLADDVVGLVQHEGIANSLLAKIDAATGILEDGNDKNDKAGINLLQAFINAVQAQSGKKILQEDADNLIAAGQEIIEILNGADQGV